MTQPNQSADATKPVANDEEAMPALPETHYKVNPAPNASALWNGASREVPAYTTEQVYDAIRKDRAGREALLRQVEERIYDAGWTVCADWAGREDLFCDCDSKAYEADREAALTALRSRPKVEARLLTDAEFSRASDGHYLPPYAREAVQRAVLEKNFPGIAVKE